MEKDDKKKKKSKKDDVFVKNTIDVNPKLNESNSKTVVLGWGRMNPITVGHEKLANKIKSVAKQRSAKAKIYLTHSQDKKKNPLSYEDKVDFAKMAFGRDVIVRSSANTIIKVLQEIDKKFDNLVLVVGQDRVEDFKQLLNKYNGKEYSFDSIEVVSAGDRDPDAEGVEGMSASKMRALASKGDFETFKKGLPVKLQRKAKEVYDKVRSGMGIQLEESNDLDEVLNIQQRRKRARTMKRYKSKIARARKRSMRRPATLKRLKNRSRRAAVKFIRKRVAKKAGENYAKLSPSQKMVVDKKVARKKANIDRISKRLLPQTRKKDIQRRSARKEEVNPVFRHHEMESPKKKRFHMMYNKANKPILDKRFRAFRKKSHSPIQEHDISLNDFELLMLIDEAYEELLNESYMGHDLYGVKKLKSLTINRKKYKGALDLLKKILDKKRDSKGNYPHTPSYYAATVARQFDGVDARTLANMLDEQGAGYEGTNELVQKYKKDTPFEEEKEDKTKVTQDPDIKDKPGTQPKVYYKGLSKKEKESRAKHFEKGKEKDDDDPNAYKPAPGDSDVKTKESKHTKKYRQMYGEELVQEGPNMERAKARIKRLKDQMKDDIDDIKDSARLADANLKNNQTEEVDLSEDSKDALKKKAEQTGIPYSILKQVYDRGMAAWKTGHRPGASQQQWAYARVNSFATKSKGTWGGADEDLAAKARKSMKEAVSPAHAKKKVNRIEEEDPCWDGYKQVGMKKGKVGKPVPNCVKEEVTQSQIQDLEKFADRLLQKFDIDVEFTRHFADRMNDSRNNPPITVAELQQLFKKIHKKKGENIRKNANSEVVLKDIQKDLNLPVVINYDREKNEFEVINKTIMRKKNFKTSNKVVKY